jgi:hypothetical protein
MKFKLINVSEQNLIELKKTLKNIPKTYEELDLSNSQITMLHPFDLMDLIHYIPPHIHIINLSGNGFIESFSPRSDTLNIEHKFFAMQAQLIALLSRLPPYIKFIKLGKYELNVNRLLGYNLMNYIHFLISKHGVVATNPNWIKLPFLMTEERIETIRLIANTEDTIASHLMSAWLLNGKFSGYHHLQSDDAQYHYEKINIKLIQSFLYPSILWVCSEALDTLNPKLFNHIAPETTLVFSLKHVHQLENLISIFDQISSVTKVILNIENPSIIQFFPLLEGHIHEHIDLMITAPEEWVGRCYEMICPLIKKDNHLYVPDNISKETALIISQHLNMGVRLYLSDNMDEDAALTLMQNLKSNSLISFNIQIHVKKVLQEIKYIELHMHPKQDYALIIPLNPKITCLEDNDQPLLQNILSCVKVSPEGNFFYPPMNLSKENTKLFLDSLPPSTIVAISQQHDLELIEYVAGNISSANCLFLEEDCSDDQLITATSNLKSHCKIWICELISTSSIVAAVENLPRQSQLLITPSMEREKLLAVLQVLPKSTMVSMFYKNPQSFNDAIIEYLPPHCGILINDFDIQITNRIMSQLKPDCFLAIEANRWKDDLMKLLYFIKKINNTKGTYPKIICYFDEHFSYEDCMRFAKIVPHFVQLIKIPNLTIPDKAIRPPTQRHTLFFNSRPCLTSAFQLPDICSEFRNSLKH